jgi:hypothetical protein
VHPLAEQVEPLVGVDLDVRVLGRGVLNFVDRNGARLSRQIDGRPPEEDLSRPSVCIAGSALHLR